MVFPRVFVVLLLWIASTGRCQCQQQKVPYFRILAPQFLCSSAQNNSDFNPPTSITISLQTRGSERLTYRVQVFFKLLDGFKSQRHTLSVWRSIRVLEKKIRDRKEEISQKNQIDILNEELVSGVEYTFNIIGVDDQGNQSPAQNFTITYRGTDSVGFDQESGSSAGDISFLLVGTWSIYRNVPFLMQGVIIFCDPNPFYEFYWNISGLNPEASRFVETQSKTLLIPGGLLQSGSSHDVSVEVRTDAGAVIAKAHGTLSVITRDFDIQLIPNNQSIGINRHVIYRVYGDNFEPDQDKLEVLWKCHPQELTERCIQWIDKENPLEATFSFPKSGLYEIFASVSLNGISKNDSAFVEVFPDIIPSVEFKSINPFEAVADMSFSAQVRINYLVPQCSAEWYSVSNSPGFESLNASGLEKGLGHMTLNDLDESFLSELTEYENDTISYDLMLTIPESSEGFKGFVGNSNYVFRLVINCPGPFDEDNVNATNGEIVSSYSELILKTHQPPVVEPLEVFPKEGKALETLFKFSTPPAIGSPGDYPMRYRFYYQVDAFWVLIGDFFENSVTSSELPYLQMGVIKTMYSVCNSRNVCSNVNGPEVEVAKNDLMSPSEMKVRMNSIEGSLARKDYSELFERLVCLIWSIYTGNDEDQIDDINKFTHELLSKDIDRILELFKSEDEFEKYLAKKTLQEWYLITSKVNNYHLKSKIRDVLLEGQVGSPQE